MAKTNTVTIIDGLLEVPKTFTYPFERTPEIMDFLASYGYGFHGLPDFNEPYAAIVLNRERDKYKAFSNCSSFTKTRTNSDSHYEITHLLNELISKQSQSDVF